MRIRSQPLGDKNIVGKRVEEKRKSIGMKQKDLLIKLNAKGIDINSSGLSKLEGQMRSVSDFELVALAEALGVSIDWLVGRQF